MLSIQNIKIPGIQPLNLNIEKGGCVGISGVSGCGKTRLLRAIADMDRHEGNVYLEDINRNEYSGHTWRKNVCLLPAESQWWFDVVENHYVDGKDTYFTSLLKTIGFKSEVLRWQINRCSSGEKQRLAIVRALINKPRVLLLDEPTSNLDAKNSRKVESLITAYLKDNNAIAIWVSHNHAQLKRIASHGYFNLTNAGLIQTAN